MKNQPDLIYRYPSDDHFKANITFLNKQFFPNVLPAADHALVKPHLKSLIFVEPYTLLHYDAIADYRYTLVKGSAIMIIEYMKKNKNYLFTLQI